jgi:hypothetical protein
MIGKLFKLIGGKLTIGWSWTLPTFSKKIKKEDSNATKVNRLPHQEENSSGNGGNDTDVEDENIHDC